MSDNTPDEPEGGGAGTEVDEAMRLMQFAMGTLKPEERQVLNDLRKEIDEAAHTASAGFDKRLEFCYAIKFSKDKIPSQRLQEAVERYIKAVEG
ncbi:MAG: hypothetical protein HY319_07555 [Armatimonadetes bacterium]|nr:hypothetical protein [Armatimonadota bacterium]